VVSVLLLVLAGWAVLSVVLGLLLSRGMRHPPLPPERARTCSAETCTPSPVTDQDLFS
jgi:hypothetical protein